MAQREALTDEVAGSRHIVEMFESTESAIDRVSAFVLDGLTEGDAVLLVLRLPHWNLISSRLTAENILVSDAIAGGRLTVLDAARTLTRILWHGVPSRGLARAMRSATIFANG